MFSFDENRYVPILFTKKAELTAVSDLPPAVQSCITPLFVVHPQEWDYDTGSLKKTVDGHLAKLPAALVAAWGSGEAFVDLQQISDAPTSDGRHPLEWIMDETLALGLELTPVCSPDRTAAYLNAVGTVVSKHATGICLRLTVNYWPGSTGSTDVDALLIRYGLSKSEVHLLLDIEGEAGNTAFSALSAEMRLLPGLSDWASLTIAGSSRPSILPGKGVHELDRAEWDTYRRLRKAATLRTPSYGDYGIGAIETISIDPRVMSISGKITYTVGDISLFARGELFKGQAGRGIGGDSVIEPCRLVRSHTQFRGGSHCAFDQWIEDVADAMTAGSSPGTWLKFGTHHHLITVVEQIASLSATSAVP